MLTFWEKETAQTNILGKSGAVIELHIVSAFYNVRA